MLYKMTIAYDGTDFKGWQFQPDEISIVGTLQKTFEKQFRAQAAIIGASRTDAGVHACAQVATCSTDLELDPSDIMKAWNDLLPSSVVITNMVEAPERFHPMYGVQKKEYWYHIFLKRPLPFWSRYGWHWWYAIDQKKFKKALEFFVGRHDFRSFCTGYEMCGTVREIETIELIQIKNPDAVRVVFKGKGFLRHMIRRIIGACIYVASRPEKGIDCLYKALEAKDPNQSFLTAPAQGLCLYEIYYT